MVKTKLGLVCQLAQRVTKLQAHPKGDTVFIFCTSRANEDAVGIVGLLFRQT